MANTNKTLIAAGAAISVAGAIVSYGVATAGLASATVTASPIMASYSLEVI